MSISEKYRAFKITYFNSLFFFYSISIFYSIQNLLNLVKIDNIFEKKKPKQKIFLLNVCTQQRQELSLNFGYVNKPKIKDMITIWCLRPFQFYQSHIEMMGDNERLCAMK